VRIVSLIPEATEILGAIGLGDAVSAVPEADAGDPERLARLLPAIRPTLVFTSKTEAGGAVPRPVVRRIVGALRPRPSVYALEPRTLGEILSDIKTVGDATGRQQQARALIEALRVRVDAVSLRSARVLSEAEPRRIACLSQVAPPIAAGWWLAELVGLAGGLDVLGGLGRPPRAVTWAEIQAARPDLVIRVDPESPPQPTMGPLPPHGPQPLSLPRERGVSSPFSPSPAHRERGPWGSREADDVGGADVRAAQRPHGRPSGGEGIPPGPRAVDLLEQIAALILLDAPRHG
jgi:hypothetical protein